MMFGIAFSAIGFVNMFWGNDPFFGVFIFAASFIYYLPVVEAVQKKLSSKAMAILKFTVGFFIVWVSLGVGELSDKIELMRNSFPYPNITGI